MVSRREHRISSTYLSRAEGERVFSVGGFSLGSGQAIVIRLKNLYANILYSGIPNFITLVDRALFGQYKTGKKIKVTQIVT